MQPKTRLRIILATMVVVPLISMAIGFQLPFDSTAGWILTFVVPMGFPALVLLAQIVFRSKTHKDPRGFRWIFALLPIALLIVATAPPSHGVHMSTQTRIGYLIMGVGLALMVIMAWRDRRRAVSGQAVSGQAVSEPAVAATRMRGLTWLSLVLGFVMLAFEIPTVINPPPYVTHPWTGILLVSGFIILTAVTLSPNRRVQLLGQLVGLPLVIGGIAIMW